MVPRLCIVAHELESYGIRTFPAEEMAFSILGLIHLLLFSITIFEERRQVSAPLTLQFEYKPSTGSTPIHETIEGRNNRIKAFYWKLWYGDSQSLPNLDVHNVFTGPEVTLGATLGAEDMEMFCSIAANNDESFKSVGTDKIGAPMDFAIVAGWQVCVRCIITHLSNGVLFFACFLRLSSIFLSSIDGDLLKLVHLSNMTFRRTMRMETPSCPISKGTALFKVLPAQLIQLLSLHPSPTSPTPAFSIPSTSTLLRWPT